MYKRIQVCALIGKGSDPAAIKILESIKSRARQFKMSLSEFVILACMDRLPKTTPAQPMSRQSILSRQSSLEKSRYSRQTTSTPKRVRPTDEDDIETETLAESIPKDSIPTSKPTI